MKVSICYAAQQNQLWLKLEVEEETTVEQAIHQSGILERIPSLDLSQHKLGIFGKSAKPELKLNEGDRVEIYRPITADPDTVERRF